MFSEKDMEDAIWGDPEKYLGEKGLTRIDRQYRIGENIFDLLFQDRHGAKLIVEIQKGTLDKKHLYKILDYYDEYKDKNPDAFIELMVIANRIIYERRRRLDHHGISWKEIPESAFIGKIININDKDSLPEPIIKKDVQVVTKNWTPTQAKRVTFFRGLLEKSKGKTQLFSDISPESGYDGSLCKSAGLSKVLFKYYKPTKEGVIQLTIERNRQEETKALYNYLLERRNNIEEEFGEELNWSPLGKKRAAIEIRYNGGDLVFPETWPKLQDTMIDAMIRFHKSLSPRIDEFRRINTFL